MAMDPRDAEVAGRAEEPFWMGPPPYPQPSVSGEISVMSGHSLLLLLPSVDPCSNYRGMTSRWWDQASAPAQVFSSTRPFASLCLLLPRLRAPLESSRPLFSLVRASL